MNPANRDAASRLSATSFTMAEAFGQAKGASVYASAAHWLLNLGGLGLFALAILDSSLIPVFLPGSTDIVLLLLTAYRSDSVVSPLAFACCAFSGSVIGGYMTWAAGKRGGEAALERLGKGRFVHRRVKVWVQGNGMAAIFLAALLPPPVPLLPFALAAGALGMSRVRFAASYAGGRALRYGALAWLGYRYGRVIVVWWQKDLRTWTTPMLIVSSVLLVLGVGLGLSKYLAAGRSKPPAAGKSRSASK